MGQIKDAFTSGSRKATLLAMGEKMAGIMDESDSIRDFAPAIKRMVELMDELDKCPDVNATKTKLVALQANAAKRKKTA